MLGALTALTELRIRGEYTRNSTISDVGHLDNVAFLAAATNAVVPLVLRRLSPTQLLLEWPAASNFRLEAAGLLTPLNWQGIESPSVPANGLHSVPVNMGPGQMFFRLTKP